MLVHSMLLLPVSAKETRSCNRESVYSKIAGKLAIREAFNLCEINKNGASPMMAPDFKFRRKDWSRFAIVSRFCSECS